jgi:hypothetical protein
MLHLSKVVIMNQVGIMIFDNFTLIIIVVIALISFCFLLFLFLKKINSINSKVFDIHKEIKFAIAPKFLDISPQMNNLIEHAIDIWRIENRINRNLSELSKDQQDIIKNSGSSPFLGKIMYRYCIHSIG